MSNVYDINSKRTRTQAQPVMPVMDKRNTHVTEPGEYSLETVATGIEIAIAVTRDKEVAQFLMKKLQQAVNQNSIEVRLTLEETRKYLDYLDILQSEKHSELVMQVGKYRFG